MKKIAIITLVLGLITIGIGFYAGGLVSEARQSRDAGMDIPYDAPEGSDLAEMRNVLMDNAHSKQNLGNIFVVVAFVTGGLGLLGGIFAGIKKAPIGWVAVVLSVIGMGITLAKATHAFA